MNCEEIQAVLFDYMTRELGTARSELVREHLRKCPDCRVAAAEIQATLDALRSVSEAEPEIPERLSDERRQRITRAVTHPFVDWMYRHHVAFSIIAAIAVSALAVAVLRKVQAYRTGTPPGVTVIIGEDPED